MKMIICILLLFAPWLLPCSAQVRNPNEDKSASKTSSLSQLPDKAEVSGIALQSIFGRKKGESISVNLNEHLLLNGTVVENVQHSSGGISINIKSAEYPGVLFNFSRTKDSKGEELFRGRIISRGSGDALMLVKEDHRYFLNRIPQDKLIAE